MKRVLVFLVILSLVVTPVSAVDFPTSTTTEQGVRLYASVSADTPWQAPFIETVTLKLSIEPEDADTQNVTITNVLISLHAKNPTGSGFSLLDATSRIFTEPLIGNEYLNYTDEFTLDSALTGENCYFGVAVQGAYFNSTHQIQYFIASNESFIGPFLILASLATPIVYVGILFAGIFTLVLFVGIVIVKRSRSISKRRRLMDD